MKKLILSLLLCSTTWASKTTLTGTITDSQGNPINGLLIMQLPVPAQDTTTNTVVAATPVYFRLVNGAVTGGAQLYDVTTLQPLNLYYIASAYDTTGTKVFGGNFNVSGGSYNLGAAIPTSVTTSNVNYAGICTSSGCGTLGLNLGPAPFTAGGGNSFSVVTFSNHNNIYWAGPGATPTIDQAIAACVTSCQVEISPGYTGPESTNLITTSLGYKIYVGNFNATVIDRRQNLATPGTPTAAPLYNVLLGGRLAGQITRTGCNLAANSANDSFVCSTNFTWVTGTLPTNGGAQMGSAGVATVYGPLTIGGSVSPIVGTDGEVNYSPTSVDSALPQLTGGSEQVHIQGASQVGNVIYGVGHSVKACDIAGGAAGKYSICYGLDALLNSNGQTNYGYHNYGKWATEINGSYDVFGAPFTITTCTVSGTTATCNTSATCDFTTTDNVLLQGVGGSFPSSANAGWTGIFPVTSACSGGTSFQATVPSGLSNVSGGTAKVVIPLLNPQSSDSTVRHVMLSATGELWQRRSDRTAMFEITGNGIWGNSTIGCLTSGGCFLGGTAGGPNGGSEIAGFLAKEGGAVSGAAGDSVCQAVSSTHTLNCSYNNDGGGAGFPVARAISATSAAFATATTAGTCVQNVTAVTGATTSMAVAVSPVSTPGVGAQWSAFVSSAGNVTINECAVATSAGGTIAFNIRVFP